MAKPPDLGRWTEGGGDFTYADVPRHRVTAADTLARLICYAALGIVATLLVLAVIHA